jgi:hypothetical protein
MVSFEVFQSRQKRRHCFLAMFPKGGQTWKRYCFPAMFPEGGQTRKRCFPAMFPVGGQTRKRCVLAMSPEGGQTRKHCFLAMFPEGEQTRKHFCNKITNIHASEFVVEISVKENSTKTSLTHERCHMLFNLNITGLE